jgi:hypothetical protein
MSAATARGFLTVAIVPMVAVSVWLALTSDHLQRPVVSALYWGYLTAAPMAIGLLWWNRRPASGFGPLLVGFGVLTWIVSCESSSRPPPGGSWAPSRLASSCSSCRGRCSRR